MEIKVVLIIELVGLVCLLICCICYVNVLKFVYVLNIVFNYWYCSYNYLGCYRLINLE